MSLAIVSPAYSSALQIVMPKCMSVKEVN